MRLSKYLALGLSVFALMGCDKGSKGDADEAADKAEPTAKKTAEAAPEKKGDTKPAAAAGAIVGSYEITKASNPGDKGSYKGGVVIEKPGDYHTLKWTIGGTQSYAGVALKDDKYLGVGWGMGGNYGVVVYSVAGGKLDGKWAASNSKGKLGTEVLEGPESLDGTFRIVEATGPSGKYSGSVTIKPTGDTYQFAWTVGSSTYKGVGIKEGSTMYVGWSVGKQAGVVLYELGSGKLDGKWAQPGGSKLGRELLSVKP